MPTRPWDVSVMTDIVVPTVHKRNARLGLMYSMEREVTKDVIALVVAIATTLLVSASVSLDTMETDASIRLSSKHRTSSSSYSQAAFKLYVERNSQIEREMKKISVSAVIIVESLS
jgi:hypothetical protein